MRSTSRAFLLGLLLLIVVAGGGLILRPSDHATLAVASEDPVTIVEPDPHLGLSWGPVATPTTPAPTTTAAPVTTTTRAPAPKVARPKVAPVPSSGGNRWDQLAQCETGGNWSHRPVGSLGYSGGTMTLPSTWRSYGGLAFAPAAWQASKAQQITVNERILADVGWRAWPGCSAKFGWR